MIVTNRITAIDFARGISSFFLIIVHTMLIYGTIETQTETILGKCIIWFGRGAALFLIAMGISFTFSKRQSFKSLMKRALFILSIAYLLNIAKFLIPEYLLGGLPNKFISAYHLKSQTIESALFFLGLGDILHLAGVTLVIIALLSLISNNKWIYFTSGIIILLLSKELSGFKVGIIGLDYICDLFFSNQYNVYFPVFPWSAFILIGIFLGKSLHEKDNNIEKFFQQILLQSSIITLFGFVLVYMNYNYHFGDYYHLGPGGCIILLGIMLFFFWIAHQLVKKIDTNGKLFQKITYLSKNITSIYVIQWVLINWGMYVFGFWAHNQITVIMLIILFTVLTLAINFIIKEKFLKIKRVQFVTN